MPTRTPTLRRERRLLREGAGTVAGIDEVGRGALAGPVTIGLVVVDSATPTVPRGVADSKLVTAATRDRLVPAIRSWAVAWALGEASAKEIDEIGIIAGLRRAALRALAQLESIPDAVILDGHHDYVGPLSGSTRVVTRVGADIDCSSVAAASILAKEHRDSAMRSLARTYPGYGWERNVGYGSIEHREAIARLGPTDLHRRSFAGVVVHSSD